MTKKQNLLKGIWTENPVLVSLLGLCSILAVTTTLENALGLGLGFTFVIVLSNLFISLIRKIIPDEIRIPIYIVVIATLVTLVEMLLEAYFPALYNSLGIWISLIAVNCIILGRAEAFASENGPFDSILDAIGMSIGYTGVLVVMSLIREILGSGSITVWGDLKIELFSGAFFTDFFNNPASAFIILGVILGFGTLINNKRKEKEVQK